MLARTRARRLTKSPQRASQVIDWRELAECKGWAEKGVDPWFPKNLSDPKAYDVAAKVCAVCPVAQQCLDAAMADEKAVHGRQRHGMYGGLTPDERYNLHRSRKRAQKNAEGKAA
ncbi:WhiB family transcriptional regulator [Arthrobacter sp.]|uniref:WhiB family transcriptional regulator n=1 Tax=Arthrobacter sp. TaxID=1667 RepID=UPI003A8EA880